MMTTREQLIENITEWLKDYEDDTGVIEIWSNQLRLLLKEYIQEPIEDRIKTIDEVISYIWQNEWREDSEDYYREHFWLKLKYKLD